MQKNEPIRPPLAWVGGKQRLRKHILPLFPEAYDTYYEPFLGMGATLLALKPKKAVIGDSCEEVVNYWRILRDDVEGLIRTFKDYPLGKEAFYRIRNMDRTGELSSMTPLERASRFHFLVLSSFHCQYHTNKFGYVNVSFGSQKDRLLDVDRRPRLRAASRYLNENNITILCGDFEDILRHATGDDLIYADPPYFQDPNKPKKKHYAGKNFNLQDQKRLANRLRSHDEDGGRFVAHNMNLPLVQKLYKGFHFHPVKIRHCVGLEPPIAQEVIIHNR